MVVRIVGAGIVTNPGLAFIDVRNIGVAGLIGVVAGLSRRRRCFRCLGSFWRRLVSVRRCGPVRGSTVEWRRPMRRNGWVTSTLILMLRKHWHSKGERSCERKSNKCHRYLQISRGATPVHRVFPERPAKEREVNSEFLHTARALAHKFLRTPPFLLHKRLHCRGTLADSSCPE
jgi:hypothetical protein